MIEKELKELYMEQENTISVLFQVFFKLITSNESSWANLQGISDVSMITFMNQMSGYRVHADEINKISHCAVWLSSKLDA